MNEHSKSRTSRPTEHGMNTLGTAVAIPAAADRVAGAAGSIGAGGARDVLTEILRAGAVDLLTSAVRAEVAAWIDDHAHIVDADGHRQVVRNGSMPAPPA